MAKKILIIGSLNMDIVLGVDEMLKPGETVLGSSLNYFPGGKGANQACSAAKLGADVTMLGAVGKDNFGSELIESLANAGVNVGRIKRPPECPTGTAVIYVDKNGQNSIVTIPGANSLCDVDYLRDNDDAFRECDYILLQMEIPYEAVTYAINRAHELSKVVVLNPAPAPDSLPDELFPRISYITPNETELSKLCGFECDEMDEVESGAKRLYEKGVKNVFTTLGKRGSLLLNGDGVLSFPIIDLDVVDTTAAGDCFNAALVVALSNGGTIHDAGTFASAASSLAVTKRGAQSSLPSLAEVEALLSR